MTTEHLVYGIHVLNALLERSPERILEIYLVEAKNEKRINEILTKAKQQGIATQFLSKQQLDQRLPNVTHQGVAARVRALSALSEYDLKALLDTSSKVNSTTPVANNALFLVLDGVQDPHNLGACIRTADAVGATAVIIPKDRSVSLTPLVQKVASGAALTVPLVEVTNLVRALEQLKKEGVWVTGATGEAEKTLFDMDLKGPTAIVLGAEGTGLRRLTEECCDFLMSIPMLGMVESLNVSVAAGVCLYEVLRQRVIRAS